MQLLVFYYYYYYYFIKDNWQKLKRKYQVCPLRKWLFLVFKSDQNKERLGVTSLLWVIDTNAHLDIHSFISILLVRISDTLSRFVPILGMTHTHTHQQTLFDIIFHFFFDIVLFLFPATHRDQVRIVKNE